MWFLTLAYECGWVCLSLWRSSRSNKVHNSLVTWEGAQKKAILSGPVFLRNFCHTTALTSICKVCIHSDIVKILLVDLSCLWDVLWSFNCEQNIHSFVACTLTLFNNHICLQDEKCRAHSHNIWAIDLDSEVSLHGTLNTHNRTLNILHNIKLAVAVSFIFFLIAGKIMVNKSKHHKPLWL